MGKLYFVLKDWYDFKWNNRKIEITEEMLEWKIYRFINEKGMEEMDQPTMKLYKNVFTALINLKEGFETIVNICVDEVDKIFYKENCVIGEILFNGILVKKFDRRFSGIRYDDFHCISEWPILNDDSANLWTVDQWKDFFISEVNETIIKSIKSCEKILDSGTSFPEQYFYFVETTLKEQSKVAWDIFCS